MAFELGILTSGCLFSLVRLSRAAHEQLNESPSCGQNLDLGAKPDESASNKVRHNLIVLLGRGCNVKFSPLLLPTKVHVMKIGSAINPEAFVYLPIEVLQQIFSFLKDGPDSQRNFWACCLVSHQWYSAAVPLLYESPCLQSRNFEHFIYTVCSPASIRRRRAPPAREFAFYIKHLDMGSLAYESSNSLTARLLGRVKGRLETFIAPAKTFS